MGVSTNVKKTKLQETLPGGRSIGEASLTLKHLPSVHKHRHALSKAYGLGSSSPLRNHPHSSGPDQQSSLPISSPVTADSLLPAVRQCDQETMDVEVSAAREAIGRRHAEGVSKRIDQQEQIRLLRLELETVRQTNDNLVGLQIDVSRKDSTIKDLIYEKLKMEMDIMALQEKNISATKELKDYGLALQVAQEGCKQANFELDAARAQLAAEVAGRRSDNERLEPVLKAVVAMGKCCVCFEYAASPQMFACHHFACRVCAKRLTRTVVDKSTKPHRTFLQATCPLCRSECGEPVPAHSVEDLIIAGEDFIKERLALD